MCDNECTQCFKLQFLDMLKQPFLLKNFFSFLLQFVTIYYDIRVMGFKKKITKSDRGV